MAVEHLLASFMMVLIFNTGSRAEDTVFVQTGASVQLDIPTHELSEINVLFWEKDSTTIVTYINGGKDLRDGSYKDRMDLNTKTFSLTLRNMQKTDSGTYRASHLQKNVAVYRVSVIDAVEAPVLTADSNWSSSDSCSVNFTCRGHDLTHSSTYNNGGCSPEEVTSSEKNNSLILICSEEFIICNHSNPVSWKTDKKDIAPLCEENRRSAHFITVMLVVAAGLIVFCVLLFYCCCRNKKGVQQGD